MDIATTYEGSTATVAVEGYLNTNTSGELEQELARVVQKTHDVVLNFAQLEYLSSTGLRVLVAAQKQVTAARGTMRIVNLTDDVREVFEITGLVDVLNVE